jgi:CheY-like chemotaxis protein
MVRIEFNRLRFLVIDDNAHMRRMLRTLLHGFGAREVHEAEDGAAGLEAFTHHTPDIVITDWAMPIFDGLELTQMIRQPGANSNPYVAIIMLTGHSEKKRVVSARDAGVTEFLAKPISAKGLYQRIVNVVANPRPFIKTKTYFGPDRRRNVNPNYVGTERRKGGKADIIKQAPLFEKVRSQGWQGKAQWPPLKRIRQQSLLTAITRSFNRKTSCARWSASSRCHPERIRSRARKRRWPTGRRNSHPGWTPNANGWTRPDAVSPPAASPRRVRTPYSTPPMTSRAKPRPSDFPWWRWPPTACAG